VCSLEQVNRPFNAPDDHVASRAEQTSNALSARPTAWAARVIVVDVSALDESADGA